MITVCPPAHLLWPQHSKGAFFWSGQFCFSASISCQHELPLNLSQWTEILATDQLRKEQAASRAFLRFQEKDPLFAPTFKVGENAMGISATYFVIGADGYTMAKCPVWT
eukprot:1159603-Pelagomonas_calceolata.AAC.4